MVGLPRRARLSSVSSREARLYVSVRCHEARADAAALTIGATAFVVGGYDGRALDAEVLGTTDGLHFAQVAALPVPVRYPAVAALDGEIYVFGGQSGNGQPVRAVQVVDPGSQGRRRSSAAPVAL